MDTKNGPVWQEPSGPRFHPGRARRLDCGLKSRLPDRKYFLDLRRRAEADTLFRLVTRVFGQIVPGGLAARQLVAAFVFGVPVVAAHPFERDLVARELVLQAFPEIAVFHGFLGGGLPAVFEPA